VSVCVHLRFRGLKIQSDANTKRHVRLCNYYLRCCLGARARAVRLYYIYIWPTYVLYVYMRVQRDDTIWSKQRVIFFIHFMCKKKRFYLRLISDFFVVEKRCRRRKGSRGKSVVKDRRREWFTVV